MKLFSQTYTGQEMQSWDSNTKVDKTTVLPSSLISPNLQPESSARALGVSTLNLAFGANWYPQLRWPSMQ